MYEVEADRVSNTLYIDLSGRMDAAEVQEAADATTEAADQLRDGFDVINDLTEFTTPSPDAAAPIKEAQETLKELGVDRVIRVVDEDTSNVVTNAFERRSTDVGYSGETASSIEEAEDLLADSSITGYTTT